MCSRQQQCSIKQSYCSVLSQSIVTESHTTAENSQTDSQTARRLRTQSLTHGGESEAGQATLTDQPPLVKGVTHSAAASLVQWPEDN